MERPNRMDERWAAEQAQERDYQATLANDPGYLEWLNELEQQKQAEAAQAIDDDLNHEQDHI